MRKWIVAFLLACLPIFGADVSGTWTFDVQTDAGSGSPTFAFEQKGEKLTGKYIGMFGEAPLTGTVVGDKIDFTFEVSGDAGKAKVVYTGTIETAMNMKGTADYGPIGKATWTAKKK
jgi:hypothetical protein